MKYILLSLIILLSATTGYALNKFNTDTVLPKGAVQNLYNEVLSSNKLSETYQMLSEWHNRAIKNWNKDEIVKISISESNYER